MRVTDFFYEVGRSKVRFQHLTSTFCSNLKTRENILMNFSLNAYEIFSKTKEYEIIRNFSKMGGHFISVVKKKSS